MARMRVWRSFTKPNSAATKNPFSATSNSATRINNTFSIRGAILASLHSRDSQQGRQARHKLAYSSRASAALIRLRTQALYASLSLMAPAPVFEIHALVHYSRQGRGRWGRGRGGGGD